MIHHEKFTELVEQSFQIPIKKVSIRLTNKEDTATRFKGPFFYEVVIYKKINRKITYQMDIDVNEMSAEKAFEKYIMYGEPI